MNHSNAASRTTEPRALPRIRVLVVDDSAVVRRAISDLLSGEADIEVVGSVASGRLAMAAITERRPDVVTLDVEMPGMDGLQTLVELKKIAPQLVVIMCSTLTRRCASVTLDALSRGAADYVAKPTNAADISRLKLELLGKIRALTRRGAPSAPMGDRRLQPATPSRVMMTAEPKGRVDLVAIGCSTGGPEALGQLLSTLSGPLPVPAVLVQHMPATFTRLLAERLDGKGGMRVVEATTGMTPVAGHLYLAPGDHHLTVRATGAALQLALNQDPPENGCRPAVDVLFRSVAAAVRDRVLAVVLTGMGQDGCRGSEYIMSGGGTVWVQDEASSAVWGMPGSVSRGGFAHRVLALEDIGPAMGRRVSQGRGPDGAARAVPR